MISIAYFPVSHYFYFVWPLLTASSWTLVRFSFVFPCPLGSLVSSHFPNWTGDSEFTAMCVCVRKCAVLAFWCSLQHVSPLHVQRFRNWPWSWLRQSANFDQVLLLQFEKRLDFCVLFTTLQGIKMTRLNEKIAKHWQWRGLFLYSASRDVTPWRSHYTGLKAWCVSEPWPSY